MSHGLVKLWSKFGGFMSPDLNDSQNQKYIKLEL